MKGALKRKVEHQMRRRVWSSHLKSNQMEGLIDRGALEDADLLHEQGNYEAALDLLNSCDNLNTDPYAMNMLSLVQLGRRDYEASLESIRVTEKILKTRISKLFANESMVHLQMGNFEEAINSVNKSIDFDPEMYSPWVNKMSILCRFKKGDELVETITHMKSMWVDWAQCDQLKDHLTNDLDLRFLREHAQFDVLFGEILEEV